MVERAGMSPEKRKADASQATNSTALDGLVKSQSNHWLIHVLGWLLFFTIILSLFFFSRPANMGAVPQFILLRLSTQFVLLIGLFYFNAYVIIPRLLYQKKIAGFIAVLLGAILVFQLINGWASYYFFVSFNPSPREWSQQGSEPVGAAPPARFPVPPSGSEFRPHPRFLDPFVLLSALLMLGISTSLMVTLKWFRDGEVQKTLEKERLASELSLLKTQINPHFFFNTLNNIYALTDIDPKVAQEAIYNLSKMMRYMLYETENDRVLLSKEIDFIRNYVDLMRLRLADSVKVDFGYPVDVGNAMVAPLILITFIENAFKHGVSYNEKSYVRSELAVTANQLTFSIRNPLLHSAHATRLEDSGIGLSNVQRRLNLLYPRRHELRFETTESEFSVHLTIQLL